MLGMTETHPNSIGRGEFQVASQPEGDLSKSFGASYFRGFTAAHTQVYDLLEQVLAWLSDDDLLVGSDRSADYLAQLARLGESLGV